MGSGGKQACHGLENWSSLEYDWSINFAYLHFVSFVFIAHSLNKKTYEWDTMDVMNPKKLKVSDVNLHSELDDIQKLLELLMKLMFEDRTIMGKPVPIRSIKTDQLEFL